MFKPTKTEILDCMQSECLTLMNDCDRLAVADRWPPKTYSLKNYQIRLFAVKTACNFLTIWLQLANKSTQISYPIGTVGR